MRIVHYLNQFFAGVGGEEAAGAPPAARPGAVGPGRALQALLEDEHEIVATVFCGDDHASCAEPAIERLLALALEAEPDLLLAGPAFTSGRYGLMCVRLTGACQRAGVPALAAMHPDNPAVGDEPGVALLAGGRTAREMRPSLECLAAAVAALAGGATTAQLDGLIGASARRNRLAARSGAERAVELLLQRLGGGESQSEVPLTGFDAVTPSAPLQSPTGARVALLTEGALVPAGNPDRLESARARRWLRYPLSGLDRLEPGRFESVHGGFSTVVANADPNRLLPLDAARELERQGSIGSLHHEYLTTVGNGTEVAVARGFGVEWAAELRRAGVQAAILTAT
jgi:betaine reductase